MEQIRFAFGHTSGEVIRFYSVPVQETATLAQECVCVPLEPPFISNLAGVAEKSEYDLPFRLQSTPKHLAPQNCPAVLLYRSVCARSASMPLPNSMAYLQLTVPHPTFFVTS